MPKPGLPPPISLALAAIAIVGFDWVAPAVRIELPRAIAYGLLGVGIAIMLLGVIAILRAGTTIDPRRPQDSSKLIAHGIFAWTRNPIYLADAVLLLALVAWLGQPLGVMIVAAFVAYIDRVQIRAEEAALAARFGAPYDAYRARVRRWL